MPKHSGIDSSSGIYYDNKTEKPAQATKQDNLRPNQSGGPAAYGQIEIAGAQREKRHDSDPRDKNIKLHFPCFYVCAAPDAMMARGSSCWLQKSKHTSLRWQEGAFYIWANELLFQINPIRDWWLCSSTNVINNWASARQLQHGDFSASSEQLHQTMWKVTKLNVSRLSGCYVLMIQGPRLLHF